MAPRRNTTPQAPNFISSILPRNAWQGASYLVSAAIATFPKQAVAFIGWMISASTIHVAGERYDTAALAKRFRAFAANHLLAVRIVGVALLALAVAMIHRSCQQKLDEPSKQANLINALQADPLKNKEVLINALELEPIKHKKVLKRLKAEPDLLDKLFATITQDFKNSKEIWAATPFVKRWYTHSKIATVCTTWVKGEYLYVKIEASFYGKHYDPLTFQCILRDPDESDRFKGPDKSDMFKGPVGVFVNTDKTTKPAEFVMTMISGGYSGHELMKKHLATRIEEFLFPE